MTATVQTARTTAELVALAERSYPTTDPNRAYHVQQHIARQVAAAESEAYAIEERRTIRPRYIEALDERCAQALLRQREAAAAWLAQRKQHGLRYNWQPESWRDDSEPARARRSADFAAERAIAAQNQLAAATSVGSEEHKLIGLAERGELVSPAHLLATVPDEYGRVSPFAVTVTVTATGRTYTSRNHSLAGAVKLAQSEVARGNRADIGFDLCG